MPNLNEKNMDVEGLAREAVNDKELFQELREGVRSKDNTIRQNSFKAMQIIAEEDPDFLYSEWDYFQEMLQSPTTTINT